MSRFTEIEPPRHKDADSRGMVLATVKDMGNHYWLVEWQRVARFPFKYEQWTKVPRVRQKKWRM